MAEKSTGELRLPLQVGTSSLLGFAHASAAFVPGFLLIASIALPALLAPWDDAIAVYPHLVVPYVFAVIFGAGLIAYARRHIRLAFSERPSDVLLGPDGLRIEGGPNNGFSALWVDIENVKLVGRHEKLEVIEEEGSKKENFWQLVLELRDGSTKRLGSAEDPRERESLEALRDSIHASIHRDEHAKAKSRHDQPRKPFECERCGAPVVPAETETVACRYCGTAASIPEDVRLRIRAMHQRDASMRRSEKLVHKLVRQPGALRTSFFVFLAAIPSLLAWPAALVFMGGLYALCFLRFTNVLLVTVATFGVIAALYYLVRGQLSDRQALRILTIGFAARAPTEEGGAHHCRKCNGPLVPPPGSMLAHCVYCGAENVLGLDARGDAKQSARQVESLDDALERRQSERARWRFSGFIALFVLGVCAVFLRLSAHPPYPLRAIGHATALKRITYDPFNEFQPKLSPDGKTLLYDLRVPGEDSDESIMMAPATGAFRGTEMTMEKMHAIRPLWLADGKGFLYVASLRKDTLRRVDSTKPYAASTDLYSFGNDIDVPSMSPDGKHFVFAGAETKSDGWYVYVGSVDGSRDIQLTGGINPAWSPDGNHIAYSRTVNGYRQIFVMTFDGTTMVDKVQLTDDKCDHEDPAFSPDATHIAYVGNCGTNSRGKKNVWDLYAMTADGKEDEQLTDGQADVETPQWDGDTIYFSADVAGNYDIWRVQLTGALAGHGKKPQNVTLVAVTPPPPMQPGQDWSGTYSCGQGTTNGVLHVKSVAGGVIDGTFDFKVTRPRRVSGSFAVHGQIDPSGEVDLDPGAWISQPKGYSPVALRGSVKKSSYTGTVKGTGCSTFSLSLR